MAKIEKQTAIDLGDLICEILTFCNSAECAKALQVKAKTEGVTKDQLIAAALASAITERFLVKPITTASRKWKS